VLPIVLGFGGRRIEAEEGGSIYAFRSPTDAVHCAAALQDATADDDRPLFEEVGRIELQIGVHQGEVHLDRKGASGVPLATARALAERAEPLEVLLTRNVYLTMSRSEAPAEEMGPRSLSGVLEPVAVYRLLRGPGQAPHGGRHGPPRPLGGAAMALVAMRVAGETEGRIAVLLRVLGAGAALVCVAGLERATGGLHALLYRAHRSLRPLDPRPRPLEGLLGLLERARRIAARLEPQLWLALHRPVRGA